jgi:hypothetical protein
VRRIAISRLQFLSLDAAREKFRQIHGFNLRYSGERAFFISRRARRARDPGRTLSVHELVQERESGRGRFGRRGAAALVQPGDEIAFEDASPARRELNDGRAFADRDQTLERTASDVCDFGGFIIGIDDEPVFARPPCALTSCVPSQAD